MPPADAYQSLLQHDIVSNVGLQQAMQVAKHIMKLNVPLMGWGLSLGRNVIFVPATIESMPCTIGQSLLQM